MPTQPAIPRPSASILLVRDGPKGLEVLTLLRSARLGFAAGMLAFPGGRVDVADGAWRLRRHARQGRGVSVMDLVYRLAALRELFEEAGLLLARPRLANSRLAAGRALRLAHRYRYRVHAKRLSFAALAERADLVLETDRLIPFAHWITPAIAPKRFDTRFYLAAAPAGQRAVADGSESLQVAWRRPQDSLAAWQAGDETLMFPTRLNLVKLARAGSVFEALQAARAAPVSRVTPQLADDGGRKLVIPEEAGFGITEAEESDLDPLERQAMAAHLEALKGRPWR
mgnify:CR=1 FL=1